MPIEFFCNVCGDNINDFNLLEQIRESPTLAMAERLCVCTECWTKYNFIPLSEDLILIDIYDPSVQTSPFKFIVIDSFIGRVPKDKDGIKAARYLLSETHKRGYAFKSYTGGSSVYTVTVMNHNSPGCGAYKIDHLAEFKK
jgi:hypothetical protein